jgi:hypothetical protein
MPESPLSMRVSKAYDVFNGDADGILARQQWRLVHPRECELITGVKRDVSLLSRIAPHVEASDDITAFDISLDANIDACNVALQRQAHIVWFDHHRADKQFIHPHFTAHINTAADVCTSLIVDRVLDGTHRAWAITAAYGDNLIRVADRLAASAGYNTNQAVALRALGECINYNAYGESIEDLHISPVALANAIAPYISPFTFLESSDVFSTLDAGYRDDMHHALNIKAEFADASVALFVLPNMAWARRVSGAFANDCANRHPARAHAIATPNHQSATYTVSIRAPIANPNHADVVAAEFGGGGRKSAAGINQLAIADLPCLLKKIQHIYS